MSLLIHFCLYSLIAFAFFIPLSRISFSAVLPAKGRLIPGGFLPARRRKLNRSGLIPARAGGQVESGAIPDATNRNPQSIQPTFQQSSHKACSSQDQNIVLLSPSLEDYVLSCSSNSDKCGEIWCGSNFLCSLFTTCSFSDANSSF